MTHNLERVGRRGLQYWYDDGLTEMAAGSIFAVLGLLFLVEALAPRGSLPTNFSAIGVVVLVAGGMWVINWAVKRLKARITYPRTGFVQYRRPPRSSQRRLLVGVLGFAVSALVAFTLVNTTPASLAWIPALQGVCIGCLILYMGYQVRVSRFYALAVASSLLGTGASVAGVGETLGNGAYFLSMGLLFVASGGVTLRRYLLSTRPPEGA